MTLRGAVDLSNYTTGVPVENAPGGGITPELVAAWIANGFTHAIIGTQWLDVFKHQYSICKAGGMTLDAYSWMSWSRPADPYISVRADMMRDYPVYTHWLDAEESFTDRNQVDAYISQSLDIAQRSARTGIYTAQWWWKDQFGNPTKYSQYDLWNANYLPNHQVAKPQEMRPPNYGGWEKVSIWQYQGSVQAMGANLDLNVIDESYMQEHTRRHDMAIINLPNAGSYFVFGTSIILIPDEAKYNDLNTLVYGPGPATVSLETWQWLDTIGFERIG